MNEVKDDPDTAANFRILLTTSLVSSLIMLDSNIVAVSLPADVGWRMLYYPFLLQERAAEISMAVPLPL